MNREIDVTYAKWGDVEKVEKYDLAILPWGATEPHNRHLPYCTDMLTAQAVAVDAATIARAKGAKLMMLPGIPLGSQNPGQVELPFCIHTSQATQYMILSDIVSSLKAQKINKLLIMSGHGGNIFKGMIRDIMIKDPTFHISVCEWFAIIPHDEFFEEKEDDHAGELETSVMLHYYPELVDMSMAGDGSFNKFSLEGFNKRVAWTPRNWAETTKDTGVGNPLKATAEKGTRYIKALIPHISKFIVDLANM